MSPPSFPLCLEFIFCIKLCISTGQRGFEKAASFITRTPLSLANKRLRRELFIYLFAFSGRHFSAPAPSIHLGVKLAFSDELRYYFFIQFVNQECERAVCRMGRARGQKMNFIRLMAFGAAASNKASKEPRERKLGD
jgi:hypothetical protein